MSTTPSSSQASETDRCISELFQSGLQHLVEKQFQAALDCFERVVALRPDLSEVWYHHGDVLANLGQYQAALESFNRALELQPQNPEFWVFRAVSLLHLNRAEDALESCDRALNLDSEHRQAWLFRGVALHRLGRYPDAYASYECALGKHPAQGWQALIDDLQDWVVRLVGSLKLHA